MVPHMFTVAFTAPGIEVQFPNVKKKKGIPKFLLYLLKFFQYQNSFYVLNFANIFRLEIKLYDSKDWNYFLFSRI